MKDEYKSINDCWFVGNNGDKMEEAAVDSSVSQSVSECVVSMSPIWQ